MSNMRGFTLIELAVVIVVVALLLGALLTPIATQYQVRKTVAAREDIVRIRNALVGYAISLGRLPCPDSTGDGLEDLAAGAPPPCNSLFGGFPWATIGIYPEDPWGRIYLYRVTQEFAYPIQTNAPAAPLQLDLSDTGDIAMYLRGPQNAEIITVPSIAALVLSAGHNGNGARTLGGVTFDLPVPGRDEDENMDGDAIFISRIQTPAQAGCVDDDDITTPLCEFDDVLVGISGSEILNYLILANRLP